MPWTATVVAAAVVASSCLVVQAQTESQPVLGHRSVPVIRVQGHEFKDLARTGQLLPYEDWRLTPEVRADDLLNRMSLQEMAGLMVHGTLPTSGELGSIGSGGGYDINKIKGFIEQKHINTFITRLRAKPSSLAQANNAVQALAEAARWGIPVTISSDPRNHFQQVLGASESGEDFSMWPEPVGFAAINDPAITRRFGDIVRQEYRAVGIDESLAPQADLATEPRWARLNGTFGSNPQIARAQVEAYVEGIQNGNAGLNSGSVAAVVKHWVGYGAEKDGWDAHNYYGRYATFSGDHFAQHLIPFEGAFAANVAGVMPTYAILQGVTLDGRPLEQVGANFNQQLLTGLLRNKYHFNGVVVSDWGITNDCNDLCRNGAPAGSKPTPASIGMPWGVENLSKPERFAKTINAGVDQIGGTEEAEIIVSDVHNGSIKEDRVRAAARRILVQKFELGLFENPYADEQRASQIAGNADFVRQGRDAQQKAVVLLQNKTVANKPFLPLTPGRKIYLYGVDHAAAQQAGFTVVDNPAKADLALIRGGAPFANDHPGYFFGSRQHEGRLDFEDSDAGYKELLRASSAVPTIFIATLERPIILTGVLERSTALLGEFGITDQALFDLLLGKVRPTGHLPFELPSSTEAVQQQQSDVPDDSVKPLFPVSFGLSYATK